MFDMYYTAIVIIGMTVTLVKEWFKPSLTIFCALILLNLGGVISIQETFSGFSNHGMLTVGVLFIVAGALQSSTTFAAYIEGLLGQKYNRTIYFKLMVPVTFLSAFLNNTPIVASLIPVIKRWAKKHNMTASKFLIPLSYAAILGGICTLIGTSTNLVVHGLMLDAGMQGFSFFELGKVGLPIAIIGILYFSVIGYHFLPDRKDIITQFGETTREFVVVMKVDEEYPYIGKSVEDAHLRHLRGLFLFQIVRNGNEIAPVSPREIIQNNDTLFFTGLPETIYELQKTPGLHILKDSAFDLKDIDSDKYRTFEVVISNASPLLGLSVRESGFRTKYDAVILGIHRSGKRIEKKVGDIVFQPNDTLFLLARHDFENKWYHSTEFSLVSPSIKEYSKPKTKGNFALLLMAAMIVAVTTGMIQSMLVAASIVAGIMILTKIISYGDAKNTIDFDVLIVIASALGIGKAVANSGIADWMADQLIAFAGGLGIIGIIAVLFLITSLYTEIITNNAAAALIFPIALSTALHMQLDPRPFMITIAIAASSSFATPMGYQTNLMVYNPGGYRFTDFLKTGVVMNVLVGILVTALVYFLYFSH
ncbi:MAG: SLC13 family permease [Caldithrix sp.]|nr:SLC13 family permease [Caldithrix sp.]